MGTKPAAKHFYPRSPRGERHAIQGDLVVRAALISIHAPREGSDALSVGLFSVCTISIHAPREGSDDGVIVAEIPTR